MSSNWIEDAENEVLRLEAARQSSPKAFAYKSERRGSPDGADILRSKKLIAVLSGMISRLQRLVTT